MTRFLFSLAILALATCARAAGGDGDWWQREGVRSCCSTGDAVWADDWHVDGQDAIVTVTGSGPRDHAWAPIGREYRVPMTAIRNEPGNPTGHGILFLNPHDLNVAHCFLPGAGI